MPRVEQRFIGTSLFMYTSATEAQGGAPYGGSGVLVGVSSKELVPVERAPEPPPRKHYPEVIDTFTEVKDEQLMGGGSGVAVEPRLRFVHLYAVTNAHVVEGGGYVARATTRSGDAYLFDLNRQDWFTHEDGHDVAVAWVGTLPIDDPNADLKFTWVPASWLATEDDLGIAATRNEWPFPWNTGPVAAGEDTFSIGRFVGLDGRDRNKPTVRFGNLASTATFEVSQRPGRQFDQESLLIEARSLSGASGAPVFAYRANTYMGGGTPPLAQALMLGVGWGHIKHPTEEKAEYDVEMETPGQPTAARYNSGIMAVVPAWRLTQLLDQPEVASMRKKYDDRVAKPKVLRS